MDTAPEPTDALSPPPPQEPVVTPVLPSVPWREGPSPYFQTWRFDAHSAPSHATRNADRSDESASPSPS